MGQTQMANGQDTAVAMAMSVAMAMAFLCVPLLSEGLRVSILLALLRPEHP